MLPIQSVAKLLRCSVAAVRRLSRSGTLPPLVDIEGDDGKKVPHMDGFKLSAVLTTWVKYPQYREYAVRTARKVRRAAELARDGDDDGEVVST